MTDRVTGGDWSAAVPKHYCCHRRILLRLEGEFQEQHMDTFHALCPEGSRCISSGAAALPADKIIRVRSYIAFFCKLQVLREQGLIDLETMDRMFGCRFFTAMQNRQVHLIIQQNKQYLKLLYQLYEDWKNFREQEGKMIPGADSGLDV